MTSRADLIRRLEEATEGSMGLSREIARLIGWVNRGNSRKGEWFHPNDVRDGVPVICDLHGTDVHREPPDFTRSLDAAMSLVPERGDGGLFWRVIIERKPLHSGPPWFVTIREHAKDGASAVAYTAPLAICAAALQLRQGDRPS